MTAEVECRSTKQPRSPCRRRQFPTRSLSSLAEGDDEVPLPDRLATAVLPKSPARRQLPSPTIRPDLSILLLPRTQPKGDLGLPKHGAAGCRHDFPAIPAPL